MLKSTLRLAVAVVVCAAPACAQQSAKKEPADILAAIKAVEIPEPDRSKVKDRAYVAKYIEQRQAAMMKQAELIGQLYQADPATPELKDLLVQRWMILMNDEAKHGVVDQEVAKVLEGEKTGPLYGEAAFFKAMKALRMNNDDSKLVLGSIDAFIAAAPKDDRGPMLLSQAAEYVPGLDAAQKAAIFDRIEKDFPDSQAAVGVAAARKKQEAVGKPFELTFNEAITGKSISMADLKGKVVVVDFWATWCGPCVAEMPTMKKLYAEYKPKGVEFIGVSLDSPEAEGGLKALKEFVAKNEIKWPQYYQGNGWESEFSASWGINSIPAVYVVDQQGKLYSVDARGKLETIIPELLKKGGEAGE